MITKDKVLEIALDVLKNKKIEYSSIDSVDKIIFTSKDEMNYPISYGKYKDKKIDYYTITYGEIWGIEERSMGLLIKADTGEPLYIITPNWYLDIEE